MALTVAPVRVRKGSGLRLPYVADSSFDPYPIDDDTPMTSSQEQYDAMTYSRSALASLMKDRGELYILKADFGLYYEAIDARLRQRAPHVVPDVMLALGVALPPFTPYRLWEVGKAPDLVLEITSPSTKKEDVDKRSLYAQLGVTEYWQYEPHGKQLKPSLECRRWVKGRYVSVAGTYCSELGALWIWSRVLDTAWGLLDTGELRLWNPARQEWFPTDDGKDARFDQVEQERDQEKEERQREQQKRQRAEQERDQEKEERQRAEQERDQEKEERQRAEQEQQRAEQERDQAQREAARLEAELRRLQARAGLDPDAAAK